ncbi:MAG: protease SohB [Gammaproteobacteria bacterium]
MHFLADYLVFLAKTLTSIIAILVVFLGIIAIGMASKSKSKERLHVKSLNERYQKMRNILRQVILKKDQYKKLRKQEKLAKKAQPTEQKRKIFVINFKGDIKASAIKSLRQEITAILTMATPSDEVVVRLESPGGMMHAYGLAASQLQRIKQRALTLTITIDQVAASGGYMMACVADKIIAAPFAVIGSIGVIAQLPNFHRLLKKNDVDFEQITAGEYKRTISLFGENTVKGREKFQEEVDDAHTLFKNFVVENRPKVNIQEVATGEHWYGIRALQYQLIDTLQTSDDYLLKASEQADIYEVCYTLKKSLGDKIGMTIQSAFDKILFGWRRQQQQTTLLEG